MERYKNQDEVDRILDKINISGMQSLTDSERDVLASPDKPIDSLFAQAQREATQEIWKHMEPHNPHAHDTQKESNEEYALRMYMQGFYGVKLDKRVRTISHNGIPHHKFTLFSKRAGRVMAVYINKEDPTQVCVVVRATLYHKLRAIFPALFINNDLSKYKGAFQEWLRHNGVGVSISEMGMSLNP